MLPENVRLCITYLLDKSETPANRVAAAESLERWDTREGRQALFQVVTDQSEPQYLREEAAGALGTLMGTAGVDYEWLIQIPLPFLDEVVNEFDGYGVKLEKGRLGAKRDLFEQRYGLRQFMAEPSAGSDQPPEAS